jgi:hypothetical protein
MEEGGFGVISNIISLYSDMHISEVVDLLTRHIFDELKRTHTGVKICIPADQKIQAKQTISEIESRLKQILQNRDWTWDKILADAQHMCGATENADVVLDVNLHPKETAQYFQVIN